MFYFLITVHSLLIFEQIRQTYVINDTWLTEIIPNEDMDNQPTQKNGNMNETIFYQNPLFVITTHSERCMHYNSSTHSCAIKCMASGSTTVVLVLETRHTSSSINPLGPRILLKHATMFPGFLANFERFYLLVFKNL